MKMRTVEVTVGVFMIAGILSLLMLALQVSGLGDFFTEESGYAVKVEFSNIGNLKNRAKVSIAGVVVGRVVSVQLEPKTFNAEVVMIIDPKKLNGPLPIDTRASIMTAGLLGDNYIALTPGFSDTEFLQAGSTISADNTDPAVVLEQLISKFVANQASADSNDKSKEKNELSNSAVKVDPMPNKELSDSTVKLETSPKNEVSDSAVKLEPMPKLDEKRESTNTVITNKKSKNAKSHVQPNLTKKVAH